jgi:hypothetical protein
MGQLGSKKSKTREEDPSLAPLVCIEEVIESGTALPALKAKT